MDMRKRLRGPVVIGGVGGSGTRVVAQLLSGMGFHMGYAVNHACDYQWFGVLFNRPRWFARHAAKESVFTGLGVVEKSLIGPSILSPAEIAFVARALVEGEDRLGVAAPSRARTDSAARMAAGRIGAFKWLMNPRRLWRNIRRWKPLSERACASGRWVGWGWKSPAAHVYLEYLYEYFPALKYIHVIRHGLDMAFSANKTQLYRWGAQFGVRVPQDPERLPQAALSYWVKANRRAVALGEAMGADAFLLVALETLCLSPRTEIERIARFVGLDAQVLDMDRLCVLPRMPGSVGRHKGHSLSLFDPEDLRAVCEFGFSVEGRVGD